MNKHFYLHLAMQNIRKNGRFYFPYILSCLLTVAGFYNMCAITHDSAVRQMPGADSVSMILNLGIIVIAIFSTIFLFYTNSFLMKRRQKELGLYNILGMEKRHIAKILTWECLIVSVGSILAGLLLGFLLSKLLLMLLFRMLFFTVHFGFALNTNAITFTVVLFSCIFLLNLLTNLNRIRLSKPIELLHGSNVGEKEPKAKWVLAIFGALCLATGYIMAQTVESPLDAILLFFVAVVLVIIGTYCLFTAGSIALLKLLKKNKTYYYKAKHFTSVSGMMYRMKQNADGLANICVLCTMVLVIISTTVSMYAGTGDALNARFPHNVTFTLYENSTGRTPDEIRSAVENQAKASGLTVSNRVDCKTLNITTLHDGDSFLFKKPSEAYTTSHIAYLSFMTAADYNRCTGNNVALQPGEVIACRVNDRDEATQLTVGSTTYSVKEWRDDIPVLDKYFSYIAQSYCFVVADEEAFSSMEQQCLEFDNGTRYEWNYAFDLSGTKEEILACYHNMVDSVSVEVPYETVDENGNTVTGSYKMSYSECREEVENEFYALYGCFLFLGLFLGALFLMATVLIMYYKQISEGHEDRERFRIMRQVGMGDKEIHRSIRSQVLTVFFLPLVAAFLHLAFAFRMITKLLALMNLVNVPLFILCTLITIAVFALVYGIVYGLTARTYYRIIRSAD